jgi:hypothetical protein
MTQAGTDTSTTDYKFVPIASWHPRYELCEQFWSAKSQPRSGEIK